MKNSIKGIWNVTAISQNTLTLSHGICTLAMKKMRPGIKNRRKTLKSLPICSLSLVPPKSEGIWDRVRLNGWDVEGMIRNERRIGRRKKRAMGFSF